MQITNNIQEIILYIIKLLLRTEEDNMAKLIGYTSDVQEFKKYKIVIIPSRFFEDNFYGKADSYPTLPLKSIKSNNERLPILYGSDKTEEINGTTIIHADIIASTYFLISRYEEMICPEVRDEHGRFIGKESMAYKAGFIKYPLVEKYGAFLRETLRNKGVEIGNTEQKIDKVYFTTDVDTLAHYRNIRSVLGATIRFYNSPKNVFKALKTYVGKVENDPWYTFSWMFNLNKSIGNENIKQIAFIKVGGSKNVKEDLPLQKIESKDFQHFFNLCKKHSVEIGLHPSYRAGKKPQYISEEKEKLEKTIDKKVVLTRNHYLCNCEPKDFSTLLDNGFTDDFTMGFADIAGFRLGTCRAVRWINPEKMQLTPLILHPLSIMDVTLGNSKYMNFSKKEAFDYCQNIIDEVKKNNGELVLLWHNQSVEKNNGQYYRALYEKIINYLS